MMGTSLGTMRYAIEDIAVSDGAVIPKGTTVMLSEECANCDHESLRDAFDLDIRRQENHHMTFGAGIHYCVGAALARMELQMATESLLRRFPDSESARPGEKLVRAVGGFIEGYAEIPVVW